MFDKEEVLKLLKFNQIHFLLQEHPPVFTMEEMKDLDLPHVEFVLKNLFLRDRKKNFLLVSTMGDKELRLKELAHKLQCKSLSFAKEEDLYDLLGLKQGHVTPLGILNDEEKMVRMVFDADLVGNSVWIHPMDNTASIYLSFDELIELLGERGHKAELVELGEG